MTSDSPTPPQRPRTGYISSKVWKELAYFYKESSNNIIKTILLFYDKKHKEWGMVIIEIHTKLKGFSSNLG